MKANVRWHRIRSIEPITNIVGDVAMVRPVNSGSELEAMLTKNVAAGNTYETWITAFCKRKYNSEFSREMSRSVGEYLKDFSDK